MATGQHTPHGLQRPHTDTLRSVYVYNWLTKWEQSKTIAASLSCHAYIFLLTMFVNGISDRHDIMMNRLTQLTHRLHEWQTRPAFDTTPPARCLSSMAWEELIKNTALPPDIVIMSPSPLPHHRDRLNSTLLPSPIPSLGSKLTVLSPRCVLTDHGRWITAPAVGWLIVGFKLYGRLICSRYHLGQHVLRYLSHGALQSILANQYDPEYIQLSVNRNSHIDCYLCHLNECNV